MSHSLRTGNTNPIKHASSHCTCPFAIFPASLLSCRSQCHSLSGPISQHTANVLTHRLLWPGSHLRLHCVCQGLKAACTIWAPLCSLAPSLLSVSRSLLLGLAPASGGAVFALCLQALPQEVPLSSGSYKALFDPPLPHVHRKWPRVVICCWMSLCSEQHSLCCRLAALRPALVLRLRTNVSAMLRYCHQP